MNKTFFNISIVLRLIFNTSIVAFGASYNDGNVNTSQLKTGDTITLGYYPQTRITDNELISKLEKVDIETQNYGYEYYQIIDEENNYETAPIDMLYGDISYKGDVYRKVFIGSNRPYSTIFGSYAPQSYQTATDYDAGLDYWFKWEPIVWRVLINESNDVYLMSELILDSQAFDIKETPKSEDGVYNIWEQCTLRKWLNDDFYNAAFTKNEKEIIIASQVVNKSGSEDSFYFDGGNDTTDNVWIISFPDALNDQYGFNSQAEEDDPNRVAYGTDYAMSQGLDGDNFDDKGLSGWLLRTARTENDEVCAVDEHGECFGEYAFTNVVCSGIRPAIKIQSGIDLKGTESHYKNTDVLEKDDTNSKESSLNNKNSTPYIVISTFALAIIVLIVILVIVLKKRKSNY